MVTENTVGSTGSGSPKSGPTKSGMQQALDEAALYVDADELAVFAQKALEHEQMVAHVVQLLGTQRPFMLPGANALSLPQMGTLDAENLQLGDFEEANQCRSSFREVVYKGAVESAHYVGAGQQVCGEVSERTRERYLDSEQGIAIDVQSLEREIESAGSDGPGRGSVMGSDFSWGGDQ
ncbi:hypothetical protein [Natronoglycomyces albus]|uniref:Uncharacterized protein n=1 Tax=Natronoglycomyces albus TaxID=2811108 RepID=A0A895XNT6_9ACTN|nr:hypothetical protein [Natronoglycomyces albus]QSB05432.1 hypothetical protein JQS30_00345 [Natronoglycomyces albus]